MYYDYSRPRIYLHPIDVETTGLIDFLLLQFYLGRIIQASELGLMALMPL